MSYKDIHKDGELLEMGEIKLIEEKPKQIIITVHEDRVEIYFDPVLKLYEILGLKATFDLAVAKMLRQGEMTSDFSNVGESN